MTRYEIDKSSIKKYGTAQKAIQAGEYIIRDEKFVRNAFNFGHGTEKDMKRYMSDNSCFCVWIEIE